MHKYKVNKTTRVYIITPLRKRIEKIKLNNSQ